MSGSALSGPPLSGPKGYPIVGVLPMLRANTLQFLVDAARRYGDLVPLRLMMSTAYLLNHPAHVEHVLQTNYKNYRKAPMIDRLKPIFGDGLVTSEDEFWSRQRSLMQPSFHRKRIEALAGPMVEVTQRHLDTWRMRAASGLEFNLSEDISCLTLEVVLKTMFSSGLGEDGPALSRALVLANEVISKRVWDLTSLGSLLPTKKNREFNKAVALLRGVVERMIEQRRATKDYGNDLLGILLEAAAADTGEFMTRELLRDEVITLMLAGYESTATMVAWAIFFLSQHPRHLEALRTEVDTMLAGRAPTAEDLKSLDYTRRVIQEVGRLRPSIWWFARVAVQDDIIGGQPIKAGTMVLISQYLLHTQPSIWDDPERFDPERFQAHNVMKRSKFAYLPFGAGPRVCIGSGFAMMEMQFILSMIFRAFDVRITSDANPAFGSFLSLRPNEDFRAVCTARRRH
ncbi:MAG: cytochrome P450 [Rhodospirillaceae bacterium]|nr:cytochrome P450 [Rhodospirillaceae bacterium]